MARVRVEGRAQVGDRRVVEVPLGLMGMQAQGEDLVVVGVRRGVVVGDRALDAAHGEAARTQRRGRQGLVAGHEIARQRVQQLARRIDPRDADLEAAVALVAPYGREPSAAAARPRSTRGAARSRARPGAAAADWRARSSASSRRRRPRRCESAASRGRTTGTPRRRTPAAPPDSGSGRPRADRRRRPSSSRGRARAPAAEAFPRPVCRLPTERTTACCRAPEAPATLVADADGLAHPRHHARRWRGRPRPRGPHG